MQPGICSATRSVNITCAGPPGETITTEATRESSILRGQGDAEKTRVLGEAYSQDPAFFAFYRSMQAYQDTFADGQGTVVLSPNSEFFKYFGQGPGAPGGAKRK